MNKFFVIFSILNLIASSCGKVVEYKEDNGVEVFSSNVTLNPHSHSKEVDEIPTLDLEDIEDEEDDNEDDFEVVKHFDDDDDEENIIIAKDDKTKDKEINEHGLRYFGGYAGYTSGSRCTKECTIHFDSLGPLTYEGIPNCYIYDGTAGDQDIYQYIGGGKYNFYTDINARLKCIVHGKTYYTVQRINIRTDKYVAATENNGYLDGKVAPGSTIYHGMTFLTISGVSMTLRISNCGKVWTYRPSDSCTVANIKMTKDNTCGYFNGETRFCPLSLCCSKYGYCGDTTDHCGTGCQSELGKCGITQQTNTSSSSSSSSSSSGSQTTTDDRCGAYNGKSCHSGYCCSKFGYCGKTKDHCSISKGCNNKFGYCTK